MKQCLLFILIGILPLSCLNITKERGLSNDQVKLKQMVDNYTEQYYNLPNEMRRDEFRKKYPLIIGAYIKDSLNGVLKCKVKMTKLTVTPIEDITAFYAAFKDSLDNEYWIEYDYKDFQKNELYKNPSYILLKDMPEGQDTVLSFLCKAVEWNDNFGNQLKIQVVPKTY
jgi:hypothetical protein